MKVRLISWSCLFVLIAGVLFPSLLSAQDTYSYSGTYPFTWKIMPYSSDGTKLFKNNIDATYQYILDEETDERVYHGLFSGNGSFNLRQKDGSVRTVSVKISGSFKNDLQEGKWDYTYIYKDLTIKCILNFDKGFLTGEQTLEWTENGKFLKLTEILKNGVYAGDISGDGSNGFKVNFHFNENGLPIGNWILSTGNTIEKFSFDETGKITKARTIDNRTGDVYNWRESEITIDNILNSLKNKILPDYHFNLAMFGADHIGNALPIFSLTYPMRKSPGFADNRFITTLKSDKPSTNLTIESIVDEEAIFPGGTDALKQWLCDNGVNKNNWYRETVSIDIYTDGTIHNVKIIKSSGPTISSELKAAFSSEAMPRWTPAKKNGQNVNSRLTLVLIRPK